RPPHDLHSSPTRRSSDLWAKGSRLIRFTPRLNPEINGYWMCDIGRFEYHWIESDQRVRRPLVRSGEVHQPAAWHDALPQLAARRSEEHTSVLQSLTTLVC